MLFMFPLTIKINQIGENKMKIVGELGEEIKKMHRNQLDSIVHGYLQTLVVSKDNNKILQWKELVGLILLSNSIQTHKKNKQYCT